MTDHTPSREQRILRVMRKVLANIVKDATPQPGMLHPLSDATIQDIRECFSLISAREAELAAESGMTANEKPFYVDEPPKTRVIPLHGLTRKPKQGD
jgi:hypothetical protein